MKQALMVPVIQKQIAQLDDQMGRHLKNFSGSPTHNKKDDQIFRAIHFIYQDRLRIMKSIGVDNDVELNYWYRENAPRN